MSYICSYWWTILSHHSWFSATTRRARGAIWAPFSWETSFTSSTSGSRRTDWSLQSYSCQMNP